MVLGVDGGGRSIALVFQTIIETLVHLSVVPNITHFQLNVMLTISMCEITHFGAKLSVHFKR